MQLSDVSQVNQVANLAVKENVQDLNLDDGFLARVDSVFIYVLHRKDLRGSLQLGAFFRFVLHDD